MEKFTKLTGIAAPLMRINVNTDTIIPTLWCQSLHSDLGRGLFSGWRYDEHGRENPDFVLNQPRYRQACILLSGENFGCGSSREAAVWALMKFGIRCVIASSFGDIFFGNSFQNGQLTVILPQDQVEWLAEQVSRTNGSPLITVDLQTCTITSRDGVSIPFTIDPARREALLQGIDQIGTTLKHEADIASFQARDNKARPWNHLPPGKAGGMNL
jgi:3-isopropylmalate/(R)-2-methylmalate dehydratase small subunit